MPVGPVTEIQHKRYLHLHPTANLFASNFFILEGCSRDFFFMPTSAASPFDLGSVAVILRGCLLLLVLCEWQPGSKIYSTLQRIFPITSHVWLQSYPCAFSTLVVSCARCIITRPGM
jgi:hypothetical protein